MPPLADGSGSRLSSVPRPIFAMRPQDSCPTCGTVLGPLHDKDSLRRCSSCSRPNPRGYYYCGYCASPMETTAHRAELAEVAAPPGGWPSLTRELIEVRFFMGRGELDEAFELLGVLRQRYPGHPELAELSRGAGDRGPRPDTQVNRVVDSVLSDSAGLSSSMPRRSAPTWNAPAAGDADAASSGARTRAPPSGSLRHPPSGSPLGRQSSLRQPARRLPSVRRASSRVRRQHDGSDTFEPLQICGQ